MGERYDFTSDDQAPSLIADRRKHVRIQLNAAAVLWIAGSAQYPCAMMDISTAGAQIAVRAVELTEGAQIELEFRLGPSYRLTGSVVWHRAEQKSTVMGIQWTGLDDATHEQLTRAIMRIAVNRRRNHR